MLKDGKRNKVGGEGGKRGSEIEKGEGRESRRGWKIAFWNMAGLGNKDRNFWGGAKGMGNGIVGDMDE